MARQCVTVELRECYEAQEAADGRLAHARALEVRLLNMSGGVERTWDEQEPVPRLVLQEKTTLRRIQILRDKMLHETQQHDGRHGMRLGLV